MVFNPLPIFTYYLAQAPSTVTYSGEHSKDVINWLLVNHFIGVEILQSKYTDRCVFDVQHCPPTLFFSFLTGLTGSLGSVLFSEVNSYIGNSLKCIQRTVAA